eukprot:c14988_g1_i1 orf=1-270(-)
MRNLSMVFFPPNYQHISDSFYPNKAAIQYQAGQCIILPITEPGSIQPKTHEQYLVAFAKIRVPFHSFSEANGMRALRATSKLTFRQKVVC